MDVIKRKKILFLFAHLHKGGMQKAVSNITQALGDEYELHVAYFGTENPDFKYNAKMHDLNIPGSLNNDLFDKLKKYFKKLRVLREFVNKNRFDIVVSFGGSANLLSLLSKHNSKKILSVRGVIDEGVGGGFYGSVSKLLINIFYKKADLIVAVSKKLKDNCKSIVDSKVPVVHIPNMYPIDEIRQKSQEPLPKEFQFLVDERYIINVGSLCHHKGQDILIKAYANSIDIKDNYKLVLVGSGPDKEKLIKLTQEVDVKEKVIFTDFQSNPYSFIRHASLFVLSSRYEGFPNVLVEAMICGVPVVAFDCPTGPREIIEDGVDGRLVKDINETSLARALIETLNNRTLVELYKNEALNKVDRYSFSNIANKWRSIFDY